MDVKPMTWGVAAALTALAAVTMTLGGCTNTGAEANEARLSADTAAAAAPGGDTSASRPVTVPAEQLERLHVEPVTQTSFRPTIQVTGTAQFNADVSTQVIPPISGSGDADSLTDVGTEVAAARRWRRILPGLRDHDRRLPEGTGGVRADKTGRRPGRAAVEERRDREARPRAGPDGRRGRRGGPRRRAAAAPRVRRRRGDDRRAPVTERTSPSFRERFARRSRTVVERLINPGQLLQAGSTPAFTVANLATMWVQANVFETDLASAQIGDRAEVTTTASPNPFVGKVTYIAALVDPATKATAVRVLVPNTRRLLKKDMYVQVTIHGSRERNGLLIPVTSVLRDDDNLPFVFVQSGTGGNTFGRRQITIGSRVGDRYEVTAGLKAGERIISEGALFVQFAQTQ